MTSRRPLPPPSPCIALMLILVGALGLAETSSQSTSGSGTPTVSSTVLPPTLPPPALLLPCDGLDTCQQGQPLPPRSPRPLEMDSDWKDHNCLCDQDCALYQDCCDDAPALAKVHNETWSFTCEEMRNFGGIYMISHCAPWFNGDALTRKRCEDADDSTDPLSSSIPVTDKKRSLTFRNTHCALCNLRDPSEAELELWGARLECPSVLTGSVDLAAASHALVFQNGTWGLRLPRRLAGSPQPPQRLIEPPEKSSKLIYDKLEPFLSANNESRPSLRSGNRSRTRGSLRQAKEQRFTTTTTTTPAPAFVSTVSGLRQLSRRHYALYNASQFHRNDSALATLLQRRRHLRVRRATPATLVAQTEEVKATTEMSQEDLVFHRCEVDPMLPDTLTHLIRRCRPKVISDCPSAWADEKVREMCQQHTAHVFSGGSTYRNVYCAMCSGLPVQQLACQQAQIATRGNFNKDFNLVAFAVLFDFGRGRGTVGTTCPKPRQIFDPFLGACRSLVCPAGYESDTCVARQLPPPVVETVIVAHENNTLENELLPECETHLLDDQEFSVMKEERLMIIAASGVQVKEGDFKVLENGSALVCNPSPLNFTSSSDIDDDKFSAMLGYITLVGLGISIICLSLHLLAFCLASERSMHGGGGSSGNSNSTKNLASLCVALLVAYCSFLAGQMVRDDRDFCVSSAVVTFYSFLAAFTWMFAVSLEIWRSLRLATTQLRTSYSGSRKQWRKFFFNSLCCWLLPACVVLAAVIVEHAPPGSVIEEARPGFGVRPGICWFSSRRALLIFFAAPVSVVMLLNAIFFTSSALMIYSTTASTSGGPRRDFRLYLRLAVLMGLTWSVGLLAGFLDTPLLWVVFVVLNTLQGLFIFLAFTCTAKMARGLREGWRYCCCWCLRRSGRTSKRRHHHGDLVCTSSSLGMPGEPDGKKLGVPSSLDHLPWSPISSTKSSQSEESSRATDETLY